MRTTIKVRAHTRRRGAVHPKWIMLRWIGNNWHVITDQRALRVSRDLGAAQLCTRNELKRLAKILYGPEWASNGDVILLAVR